MLIDIEPKFDNTTAKASYNGDELIAYRIYPNEGYLLHTTSYDEPILDDEGNETGEVKKGYTEGFISLYHTTSCNIGCNFVLLRMVI